jgi:hypothetical protein
VYTGLSNGPIKASVLVDMACGKDVLGSGVHGHAWRTMDRESAVYTGRGGVESAVYTDKKLEIDGATLA